MRALIQTATGGAYFVLLLAACNCRQEAVDPVDQVTRWVAIIQLALLAVIAVSVWFGTRELLKGLRDED